MRLVEKKMFQLKVSAFDDRLCQMHSGSNTDDSAAATVDIIYAETMWMSSFKTREMNNTEQAAKLKYQNNHQANETTIKMFAVMRLIIL